MTDGEFEELVELLHKKFSETGIHIDQIRWLTFEAGMGKEARETSFNWDDGPRPKNLKEQVASARIEYALDVIKHRGKDIKEIPRMQREHRPRRPL